MYIFKRVSYFILSESPASALKSQKAFFVSTLLDLLSNAPAAEPENKIMHLFLQKSTKSLFLGIIAGHETSHSHQNSR